MILGLIGPLVDTSQVAELARQVTPTQMAILGVLALIVALTLFRKLIKAAVLFAVLAGIVAIAVNTSPQDWFSVL